MKSIKSLLIAATFSVLALESSAWAGGSDPDCSKLAKGDKVACAAKAKTVCADVEGYWPKRKCVSKVAQGFNLCAKDGAFSAMCVVRKSAYWDICTKAGELDMNKPKTLPEFKRRALAYADTLKKAKAFENEWGMCFARRFTDEVSPCAVSPDDLVTCEKAGAEYKKAMKGAVDWYLSTTMPNALSLMDKEMAGKWYKAAKGSVVTQLGIIKTLQNLNRDLPMFAHREADLSKAAKSFNAITGLIDGIANKAKAEARCPKGKNNNKRLVKAMSGSVSTFFGSGPHARKVRVMRLNGKKSVTANAIRQETTESYPAFACTEGLPTSQNAKICDVFNISVKRTRVKRNPWGPWKTYVGNSVEMLCKNIK